MPRQKFAFFIQLFTEKYLRTKNWYKKHVSKIFSLIKLYFVAKITKNILT